MTDHPRFANRPRRKRSRHVALILAGAAVFSLSACKEDQVEAQAFPDLESCLAAAKSNSLFFKEEDCRTQFAAAQQELVETAPRYNSKELCEQEHGAGACGSDPAAQQGGGGMSFMPLLMGFMLGQMLGGRGVASQPMIRTPQGFSTPNGSQSFATNSGRGNLAPSAFNRAPTTMGKPPMTPAQVSQRGGFGASRTAAPAVGGKARSVGG